MADRNLRDLLAPLGVDAPAKALRDMTRTAAKRLPVICFWRLKATSPTDVTTFLRPLPGVAAVVAEADGAAEDGSVQVLHGVPVVYLSHLNENYPAWPVSFITTRGTPETDRRDRH